ncbi:GNAT family N-acetyltransferase [Egbenema bharatensis]|uniref:GNAT family N-acetyltransferase n=1 Tax=Egbenema bharatensis TaxID=3463334 RepID=UPI003A8C291B
MTMLHSDIELRHQQELPREQVVSLYRECGWSSAEKPDRLLRALANSDTVISAWQTNTLIGLGNAISDGSLVVYYPHLLVRPAFQKQGIGQQILSALQERYADFHQQILLSNNEAVKFYQKQGFQIPQSVIPLWIYQGRDQQ